MIPFGPWRPDQYDYNSQYAAEASGVLPGANSYAPWPQLSAYSLALSGYCRGAYLARKTDGSYVLYAGTAAGLYKFVGPASAWTDVTKSATTYNLANDEFWSFDQFGTNLYACHQNDPMQVLDIEAGSAATDATGSPPRARFVKTVGDQLFLGGLSDNPNRLQWSGRNDPTYWTPGSRDSDYQDFPDGGFVQGMTALELGLVLQETAIRRFAPVNTRAIFEFARIEDQRGLIAPSSLVVQGHRAFYLSENGFYATDGAGASVPIGVDVVDAWFQDDVNYDRVYSVVGAADPVRQRIFWIYPSVNNTSALLDRALCYDVGRNQWTHADIDTSFILGAATPGYTLDTIDALGYTLDTLPFSLDSRFLLGGAPYLAAFDSAYKLALFSGAPMAATLETASFQAIPGRRATIRGVRPFTDGDTVLIQVGKADRPQDAITWNDARSLRASGVTRTRATGLSHRIRATFAAGDSWTHIQGVDIEASPQGAR